MTEKKIDALKEDISYIKKSIDELSIVKDDTNELKRNINEIKSLLLSLVGNKGSFSIDSRTVSKLEVSQGNGKLEGDNISRRDISSNNNSLVFRESSVSITTNNTNATKEPIDVDNNYNIRIESYIKALKKDIYPTYGKLNPSNEIIGNSLKFIKQYFMQNRINEEYYKKYIEYINRVIELNVKLIYLKIEKEDLSKVLDAAFDKDDCSSEVVQILMDRNNVLTNKIKALRKDLNDKFINFNIKTEYFISKQDMDYCKGTINDINYYYDNYTSVIHLVLNQLNIRRLISVFPNSSFILKKMDTYNNISVYECLDKEHQQRLDKLLKKYEKNIYDHELILNHPDSFYMNENSFYDEVKESSEN